MILIIILFAIALYLFATRNHDYWRKRKVKHDPTLPFFGNHFRNLFGLLNLTSLSEEYYRRYRNEKVVGYYKGSMPELFILDLDIIRRVMNVDFPYFYPRGVGRDPKVEPLLGNLFHSDDDTWKLLRQRLTPAFTTAKLKNMFPLVVRCAEKLQSLGEETVSRGGECDVRELMARFTTEFIGACGFGIEMDTINNEKSLFRDLGKLIFFRSPKQVLLLGLWELVPMLRKYIHISNPQILKSVMHLVEKIRKQRNYKPIGRNDFIDLLLELEAKGKIKGESIERKNPDGTPAEVELEMDLKCMAAQVFIFFAAGFETSSSVTSFTLHQLAFHPEVQEKIQKEIDRVMMKYDNKLCYDAVAEMSLLEMAFQEALRLFPSLGVLNRVCAKRYTIPELGITIDPGVKIVIPVKAIQSDEKYFDNPNEFKPERFTQDEINKRPKYTYMPFGEGPRACIGARLGQMQSMAGLAAVLHKFSVEPTATTQRQLQVDPKQNIVQVVLNGVPLKLKLRDNSTT